MRFANTFTFVLLIFLSTVYTAVPLNPYSILQVSQTASIEEIESQYKKLRSRNRRSRAKKGMIRRAYDQILFDRQFGTKERADVLPKPSSYLFPEHIDQNYVYGYKLSDQFDDGSYFQTHFNQTQFIIQKQLKTDSNKKTATLIVFLGSIMIKIVPCIILFCLCRRGGQGGLHNALSRARAGYVNIGRRGNARI